MKTLSSLFGSKSPPTTVSSEQQAVDRHVSPDRHTLSHIQEAMSCSTPYDLQFYIRHCSGYHREAALARCVELRLPELLDVVAIRVNDWVPQVRRMARKALMATLPYASPSQVLPLLPKIFSLHGSGRGEDSNWLEEFVRVLGRTFPVEAFIAGLNGPDIKIARACVVVLKENELVEPDQLLELMLKRNDDIILANLAMQYCAALPKEAQLAQYKTAFLSHFGSVRTLALRKLLAEAGESCHQSAMAALEDPQSHVRFTAINYLRARGIDVRGLYLELLNAPGLKVWQLRIVLTELANFENTADHPRIQSFRTSANISIRRAALKGWYKVAPQDKDEIALRALEDEAPGVRKLAFQLVCKHGAYLPFSRIEEILLRTGDRHLLLMFAETEKWKWLEYIAKLSQDATEASDIHRLRESLRSWFAFSNRGFDSPSEEQARFLTSSVALSNLKKLMPDCSQQIGVMAEELKVFHA